MNLFLHFKTGIKGAHDGAHALGGTDGRESGDAGADDQYLGRRHFTGGGDLTGKEAAEYTGRFNDGAIAGDVGHRAQGIHLLRARDTRHAVHGQHIGAGRGQLFHQIGVLSRPDERDQSLAGTQQVRFVAAERRMRFWRPHLEDDVGVTP